MRFARLIALGLALLPIHAYAGSLSCPAPGVIAQMSDGSRFEFQGADTNDHNVCVWRTVSGTEAHESRFLLAVHSTQNEVIEPDQMRQILEAVFEPSSHGVVSAVLNNGKWNSSLKTRVTATAGTVTVPAGRFPVIVVKIDAQGVFGNDGNMKSTYYLDQTTHVPLMVEETLNGNRFVLRAVKVTAPGH